MLGRMLGVVWATLVSGGCGALVCGASTVESDGVCESTGQRCGPGTVSVDDECVVETQLDCGQGTVLRGESCVPAREQFVMSPLVAEAELAVSQGFHGYFSHTGGASYAVDIPLEEGTPIVAVREGVVRVTRSDSDSGCGEPECSNQANYVVIDHGDGTFGGYWHLEYDGVDVEPGERVGQGQPIGRSGNTGFSTGPHLHLQVSDVYNQSLPLRFEELVETNGGMPSSGVSWRSENEEKAPGEHLSWSSCLSDTFAHMGVTVEAGGLARCESMDDTINI